MHAHALDAALAAINQIVPWDEIDQARQLIAAKCRALVTGYHAKWIGSDWRADAVEQTVHLPIVNPESGRTSRTWTQAGKFDGIVSGFGRRLLLEHKTVGSSEDIADPSSAYWRRLAIDSQVSAYMLQSWQGGEKLDGILYDVIRKPALRPAQLTKAGIRGVLDAGEYHGFRVSDETAAWVAEQQHGTVESHELFTARLAADLLAQPDRYYQRRQIPRLDSDVLEYATELWDIGQEILAARNNERHYRNSAACMEYGRPCEYLGVCSGFDTIDSDRWQRADRVHGELNLDHDGRSILTHSRIKTFQTCRRKHYYRYELGIRRRDEEDSEVLFLGSLMHTALEAWWLAQGDATATPRESATNEGEGNGESAISCPAIAVDQPAAAATC